MLSANGPEDVQACGDTVVKRLRTEMREKGRSKESLQGTDNLAAEEEEVGPWQVEDGDGGVPEPEQSPASCQLNWATLKTSQPRVRVST